jgi:lipid-binding SYLF domain-containing protein
MKRLLLLPLLALLTTAGCSSTLFPDRSSPGEDVDLVAASAEVVTEIYESENLGIPSSLIDEAEGVAVFPGVIRAALGIGGQTGEGVFLRRTEGGGWSDPYVVELTGASLGLQIGGEESDVMLFFMTDKSAAEIADGGAITLGGDISIAAGPYGRDSQAATNAELNAEVISYAVSRGAFAGISLSGAQIDIDEGDTRTLFTGNNDARDAVNRLKSALMAK